MSSAFACCDGAMDGGAMTGEFGGLTSEIECFADRFREGSAGGERVGGCVTIRSPGKWVGVPIVEVCRFQKIGDTSWIGLRDPG